MSELVNQGERADRGEPGAVGRIGGGVPLVGGRQHDPGGYRRCRSVVGTFPLSAGSVLAAGRAGLSDHPKLQPLFQWRDQIELKLMERTLKRCEAHLVVVLGDGLIPQALAW